MVSKYRKALVALAGLIVLFGQAASDGSVTPEEWGQLVTALAGVVGVWAVPKEFFGKAVTAAVALAGVVSVALADGNLSSDEVGQLVLGLLAVFGVGAVRNSPGPADRA
jgi:hypothetical protein